MKLRSLVVAFAVAFTLGSTLSAQTPAWKLAWDTPDPLANAQADVYSLQINSAAATIVVPTCTAQGTGSTCLVPLGVVKSGDVVKLTIFNAGGSATGQIAVGAAPTGPLNIRIVITVTIP